jgi:YbbR domain-containing protein
MSTYTNFMRLRVLRPRERPPAAEPTPGLTPAPPGPPQPTPPWKRLFRFPTQRSLREALQRNRALKILSLILAFFLWFSINVTERDAERIVELPVSIRRLAPGLVVTNLPAKPIAFTLRGPRTILDGVDERKLRASLDLSAAAPGESRLEVTADMIRPELPRRLKMIRVEPSRLKLRVERLVRRRLPVRADLAGMPALGYTVAESTVTPNQVEVSGPASKVDDLKEIATETVDLRGLSETMHRDTLLSWAGDFVSFTPEHVVVTVTVEEVMVSREFKHVDVQIVNATGRPVRVTPSQVDLAIRGPQRLLHNYRVADGAVTVDAGGLPPGLHRIPVHVDLPPALELTRRQPDVLMVQVGEGGSR